MHDVGVGMTVQVVLYSAVWHERFGRGLPRFPIQHVDAQALPVYDGENDGRSQDRWTSSGAVYRVTDPFRAGSGTRPRETMKQNTEVVGQGGYILHMLLKRDAAGDGPQGTGDVAAPTPRFAPGRRLSSDQAPPGLAKYPN